MLFRNVNVEAPACIDYEMFIAATGTRQFKQVSQEQNIQGTLIS